MFEDAKIRRRLKVMEQVGIKLSDPWPAPQHPVRRGAPENQAGEEPGQKGEYYCDG